MITPPTTRRTARRAADCYGPGVARWSGRRTWLGRVVILAVVAVVTVLAFRLIGEVDWDEVGHALGHLAWWQVPLLIGLLLVRQVLNSLPLTLYIAGMTPYRATLNDQVAVLIGTMVPPPADLALRTAMFSSWGIPIAQGVAGTLLHKLTFYIVRYCAPAAGLLILLARGDELGVRLVDLAFVALGLAILAGLLLVMRSTALARSVGRHAGRVVARVRRSVDPEAWAASCADFHRAVGARFHGGFVGAIAALAAMLAVDATMLLLCLHFVGVHGVPAGVVVAGYLVAFPLTLFPFSGIGLLDAAVVAAITADGRADLEAAAVAGMILWRIFTLGGLMLMGVGSLVVWHRTSGSGVRLRQAIGRRHPGA
jgi:putative heme transporter